LQNFDKSIFKLNSNFEKHIRAKLLATQYDDTMSLASCDSTRSVRAIMPPLMHDISSSRTSLDEIRNDFAIDITHIEKFVQESDSIIMDKK